MFSLFGLLQKFSHVFIFLLLEGICFYLIVNYNTTQKEIFIHSTGQLTGNILNQSSRLNDFLLLEEENKRLTAENSKLIREVISLTDLVEQNTSNNLNRTLSFDTYPAEIISQTIHSNRNHIIINKGSQDSLSNSMGLINDIGVVGIITHVNNKYSKAISLLNVDCKISSTVKGNDYFGTMSWDGKDLNILTLSGIPKHAKFSEGDTVITNGYSTIFPPNLTIGTIVNYNIDRSNEFYNINVKPIISFGNLKKVYVVNNNFGEEILSLQREN